MLCWNHNWLTYRSLLLHVNLFYSVKMVSLQPTRSARLPTSVLLGVTAHIFFLAEDEEEKSLPTILTTYSSLPRRARTTHPPTIVFFLRLSLLWILFYTSSPQRISHVGERNFSRRTCAQKYLYSLAYSSTIHNRLSHTNIFKAVHLIYWLKLIQCNMSTYMSCC